MGWLGDFKMSKFDAVQEAARKRAAQTRGGAHIDSEIAAQRIFEAAEGDARRAYDYLDAVNRHLTRMLQGKKQ